MGLHSPPPTTRYSERVGRAVLALRAADAAASTQAYRCGRCGHADTLNIRSAEASLLAAIRDEFSEAEAGERAA